jgi:acyl-CoA thioesterase-1
LSPETIPVLHETRRQQGGDGVTTLRICFVGDSITNGTTDSAFLGWPGRLCADEAARGHELTLYNLGIRAETTAHILPRWRAECAPRLPDHSPGAIVFAFGINDMAEEGGTLRCPFDESVSNARRIVDEARAWKPVLWVGPAPVEESMQPLRPAPGVSYAFQNRRAAELSESYRGVAAGFGVPYLELYGPLASDPLYRDALRASDGVHPSGEGYARIAALVAAWPAWRAWLDGPI